MLVWGAQGPHARVGCGRRSAAEVILTARLLCHSVTVTVGARQVDELMSGLYALYVSITTLGWLRYCY